MALIVFLTACARTMIPTPNLYANTSTPLFGPLAPELQGDVVQILYATDRQLGSDESGEEVVYGAKRSASLAFGVASVQIAEERLQTAPDSSATRQRLFRFRPEIKVINFKELVRFPATPYLYRVEDNGRIKIDSEVIAELGQTTAQAREEILRRLALTPRKEVYVDVHGVNTEFNEAILSLAEFYHFIGREGVPIVYTWPAGAEGLFFYTIDRESGEFTVLHLKQFLKFLASVPEIDRMHLIAHSRGTDVVSTALRELIIESRAKGFDPREQFRIENLVFFAADLDMEVVTQRLTGEAILPAFARATLYTNAEDDALAVSKNLFGGRQRAGALRPSDLPTREREVMRRIGNFDVIAYEGLRGGFFQHSYYNDPAVSSDILMLLRYGWLPGEGGRQGLKHVEDNIWRLTDDYLVRKGTNQSLVQ